MSSARKRLFSRRLAPLTVVLLALGAGEAAFAARDTKTEFKVNEAQTALETDTKSECAGGEPGCKEARRNQKLKLKMRLKKPRSCNRAPGAEWRLQAVYLGGVNSASKPSQYGNLPPQVTADFDVDAVSGLVIPQSSGATKIDFFNQNRSAYTIWYRVTAVCVDQDEVRHGDPIESDPRIINRGTGVS